MGGVRSGRGLRSCKCRGAGFMRKDDLYHDDSLLGGVHVLFGLFVPVGVAFWRLVDFTGWMVCYLVWWCFWGWKGDEGAWENVIHI